MNLDVVGALDVLGAFAVAAVLRALALAVVVALALAGCTPGDGQVRPPSATASPSPPTAASSTTPAPTAPVPGPTSQRPPPGQSSTSEVPTPAPPSTRVPTTTATTATTATTSRPTTTSHPTPSPTLSPTAAPGLPAALRGRVLTRIPTDRPVIALTFDGGASDTGVAAILRALAAEQVRATFFVTGDFAARYPARVRAIAAAGHRIGNHSASHPDFATLTAAEMADQLGRAQAQIQPLAGRSTQPWFRFPFGSSPAVALRTVNDLGYAGVGWTVDSLGWQGTTEGRSVASVTARVLAAAQPGAIVLMHVGAHPEDGSTLDADALPGLIAALSAQGYDFVTLDAALP